MIDIRTGKELNDTYLHGADKVQITRRDFLSGSLAAASTLALSGSANATVRHGLGARMAANFSEGEEDMYKELYEALKSSTDKIVGKTGATGVFDDNTLEAIGRSAFVITNFTSITLRKTKYIGDELGIGASCQYFQADEVIGPCGQTQFAYSFRGTRFPYFSANKTPLMGYYAFNNNGYIQTIHANVCKNFGNNSLAGTSALADVYCEGINKSEAVGFPWGSTNPNTVFHYADANYDYQGNVIA